MDCAIGAVVVVVVVVVVVFVVERSAFLDYDGISSKSKFCNIHCI